MKKSDRTLKSLIFDVIFYDVEKLIAEAVLIVKQRGGTKVLLRKQNTGRSVKAERDAGRLLCP